MKKERVRRTKLLGLYRFYSICGVHYDYKDTCDNCNTGSWGFRPGVWLSQRFYKLTPGLWQWWMNRPRSKKKWLNSFTDLRTGKKVNPFPNLK